MVTSGLSPLAVGAATLVAMLLYFWLSGAMFPADTRELWMTPAQLTGMALTYSTTPAFLRSIRKKDAAISWR